MNDNSMFKDKTILITGGTGSVGSALVKELLKHNPAAIRVFDQDETKQFNMAHKLNRDDVLRFFLGDVRDKDRLLRAFSHADIVFHCAALKHVLSSEYNPFEAVKTNVIGTQNVVDAALDAGVEKVILTSSDKAVNPCNVMGSTKLLAERLVTSANYYKGAKKTVFTSVRFGNVLGSRGSVIPLFKRQINMGGPVTVTDPNMTRFVMTAQHTIDLLFKATSLAQGGEIFVLKMPTVKLGDLVDATIEKYAKGKNIEKKMIGALPGEKFYEELMTGHESTHALEREDMFIITPEFKDYASYLKEDKYKAKQAKKQSYSSNLAKPISKDEIIKMLGQI